MEDQTSQRRISVLMFPTEKREFAAMPLGVGTFTVEPTLQEALDGITSLINGHVASCLAYSIPPDRIFGTAEPKFHEIFERSQLYDYQAYLLPKVKRLVSGVDYRISDQVIDNDAFARYLKGEMQ